MTRYRYKAIDRSGLEQQGHIDALAPDAARALLADRGLFVNEIAEDVISPQTIAPHAAAKTFRLSLSEKHRTEFIDHMAGALQAQLPLVNAIQVVGKQNPNSKITFLTGHLEKIIRSGQSFSTALAQFPRIFDMLHISLVQAGESGGFLEKSMTQLARLNERNLEIKNNILTAILYPAFVLCLGLISIGIVITWILPQIIATLSADVAAMPWPTRVIIAVSSRAEYWVLFIPVVVILFIFVFRQSKRSLLVRFLWDSCLLKIPVLGQVKKKWAVANFARTLGVLTQSNVNILESLQIVRGILNNEVLARNIDHMIRQVRTGSGLAQPLRQYKQFPPLLVQIVAIGEETGQLPQLLLNAADTFDKETQIAVKRFMAIFPAILIVLLALFVGFVVAAILLPIIQIETVMPGV